MNQIGISARFGQLTLCLLFLFGLLSTASVDGKPIRTASTSNNVYIHPLSSAPGTQIFILKDYSGNINANSLTFKGTSTVISLMHPPNCYGAVDNTMWYFTLGRNQIAQLTNYAATPTHFALWVPVDSSAKGQDPSTCWFSNQCFSYPFTFGSPATATPAGATFVEFNVSNSIFDTVDISEVNGVNAAWRVDLPAGWQNNAFLNTAGNLIPVQHIQNNPGASPNFYGDYGNPGVYPFGCTNCASRYNNVTVPANPPGTQKSGCLQADSNAPVTYPTMDVGCDNAINYYPNNAQPVGNNPPPPSNPALPAYEMPPPGVASLPSDNYAPQNKLFDLKTKPATLVGYGICNILRGSSGTGGDINILLTGYPFGQKQQ